MIEKRISNLIQYQLYRDITGMLNNFYVKSFNIDDFMINKSHHRYINSFGEYRITYRTIWLSPFGRILI